MSDVSYIPRRAAELVTAAMAGFRVLVVNGPRQSGKSTLLRQMNASLDGTLVTLDDRTALKTARTDPGGFVTGYPYPLMIDEVQRGGDALVLAVKALVDRNDQPGQIVLAGSSRFLTVPTLSESLAGRARIIDLWPLSQGELTGGADALVDRLFGPTADVRQLRGEHLARAAAMERIVVGGFPGVHRLQPSLRRDWFDDYRRTLVQRDLSEIRKLRQIAEVPRLIRLMAAHTASEVNVSKLSTSLGLAAGTAHEYLSLLEVIYVHHLLPGWAPGFASRAKRKPKLHFVDSGLAADTLGVSIDRLAQPTCAEAGPLLETFVAGELARQRTWSTVRPDLFHFRDREQREVDIVAEAPDGRVVAIEVKAAVDVDDHDTRWLRYLRDKLGDRFVNGVVLHLGERPQPLGDRLTALPLSTLWA
jgi:uncharacterized protein